MKQFCVISCPIDTYSGYGSRARDFFKALYELKKEVWDFKILSQRWGVTPWGYIKDHKEEWGWVEPLIIKDSTLPKQPDVWIQITIPNEFQPIGKYNIGVTAGIETTICDPSWIEGCNRMNINLVSSNHSKKIFESCKFEKRDQTGKILDHIKLSKPVEVLFEGVDLNKYFHIEPNELKKTKLVSELDNIQESFCFLYVGHWLQGEVGEDRKNAGLMLKTFLETFQNKKEKPALILKTSGAGASIIDKNDILKKIDSIKNSVGESLPNVYLLHGELSDEEINNLYNHPKVKAMINISKGEGFCRPLLEFSLSKKPIIASGWSGQLDFLQQDLTCLVGGELKKVHPSAVVQNIILPDSQWFYPNIPQVKHYLKEIYEDYKKYKELAKQQGYICKTNFNYEKMKESLLEYLKQIPTENQVKLPTLNKINISKL